MDEPNVWTSLLIHSRSLYSINCVFCQTMTFTKLDIQAQPSGLLLVTNITLIYNKVTLLFLIGSSPFSYSYSHFIKHLCLLALPRFVFLKCYKPTSTILLKEECSMSVFQVLISNLTSYCTLSAFYCFLGNLVLTVSPNLLPPPAALRSVSKFLQTLLLRHAHGAMWYWIP